MKKICLLQDSICFHSLFSQPVQSEKANKQKHKNKKEMILNVSN